MNCNQLLFLGISGSPREGSTSFSVKEALRYAKDKFKVQTDYFSVRNKNINFCIHCDYCIKEKKGCIHKDDMVEVYSKIKKADAYIVGSPIYNGSISGQLKTLFDRCRALAASNLDAFKNKVGVGIAVGGDRAGGQELTLITIHSFYLANNIIPTSGGPFGSNLGATIWSHDLGKNGAESDREGLKSIYKTIDRLAELTKQLKKLQ